MLPRRDERRDERAACRARTSAPPSAPRSGGAVRWLTLGALLTGAGGANWAQVSGEIQQNVVVPYLPGTQRPHWSGRTGLGR